MNFIDLQSQLDRIRPEVDRRIREVLDSGAFILGPQVTELEQRLARFVGVEHCVACASGTDALTLAYLALGIGPGDEVLTSPFSFIAAAESAALIGARPTFCDIDRRSYNMNPDLIADQITPLTRAIVPVDLFGQCALYERIEPLALERGIPIIEDAAQSLGALRNGRRAGSFGRIAITSFYPAKPLGGYGDGGACFTGDADLAERLRQLRIHGQGASYRHDHIGITGRLDTLQAAVLLAKLDIFEDELDKRSEIAKRYGSALTQAGITTPHIDDGNVSVYAQYTIEVDERERVRERLSGRGVPTAIYYPIPLHQQPAVGQTGVSCPQTELAAQKVLSLPFSPYLKPSDQDQVIEALIDATR